MLSTNLLKLLIFDIGMKGYRIFRPRINGISDTHTLPFEKSLESVRLEDDQCDH